tara:strand:- start:220 stop:429 length:210 start_codon:yes stop_codon:yes gene_type:complete
MSDYKLIEAMETDHGEARVYVAFDGKHIELVILSEGVVVNILDRGTEAFSVEGQRWETWPDIIEGCTDG